MTELEEGGLVDNSLNCRLGLRAPPEKDKLLHKLVMRLPLKAVCKRVKLICEKGYVIKLI